MSRSDFLYAMKETCLLPTITAKTGHAYEWIAIEKALQNNERMYSYEEVMLWLCVASAVFSLS